MCCARFSCGEQVTAHYNRLPMGKCKQKFRSHSELHTKTDACCHTSIFVCNFFFYIQILSFVILTGFSVFQNSKH